MSVTFSPETDRRTEAFTLTALFCAAVAAVVVFFPPEGQVLVPVHDGLSGLLGQITFVVPLGLALASSVGLVRHVRPGFGLPKGRLLGLGVIAMALMPAEHLMGQSTGLVGDWFTSFLTELLGGPLTVALILALVTLGSALAFNLKPSRLPIAAR
jgi:hypothetical protein